MYKVRFLNFFKKKKESNNTIKYINSENLTGKLVIATPKVSGTIFDKSVIYIIEHEPNGDKGTSGIVINSIMNDISFSNILDQFEAKKKANKMNLRIKRKHKNPPIHFGGPVSSSQGFILHSADYKDKTSLITHAHDDEVLLTSNDEIITKLAKGKGPKNSLIALGHVSWGPGELENEILDNYWLVAPATKELVFNDDNYTKWNNAAKQLGIDFSYFTYSTGAA